MSEFTPQERMEQIHQAFDEWLKKADPHNLFVTSHGFAREAWQDALLSEKHYANPLKVLTSEWQTDRGENQVPCHSRMVDGVLCRWWGDDMPPGVAKINAAAALVSSERVHIDAGTNASSGDAAKVMEHIVQANEGKIDEQARNMLKASVVGVGVGPAMTPTIGESLDSRAAKALEYLLHVANAFDPVEGAPDFTPNAWAAIRNAIYDLQPSARKRFL